MRFIFWKRLLLNQDEPLGLFIAALSKKFLKMKKFWMVKARIRSVKAMLVTPALSTYVPTSANPA